MQNAAVAVNNLLIIFSVVKGFMVMTGECQVLNRKKEMSQVL